MPKALPLAPGNNLTAHILPKHGSMCPFESDEIAPFLKANLSAIAPFIGFEGDRAED